MFKRILFIAGNWKMNNTPSETEENLKELRDQVKQFEGKLNIAICPAFPALDRAAKILKNSNIKLGAQDVSDKTSGAYTGDISAEMLKDLKVKFVIIGHSERRQYHHETNALVNKKLKTALTSGLFPIVCIGETLQEREKSQTEEIIRSQFNGAFDNITEDEILKTTIAYEPVWAIGTGKTASPEQAQETHALIRKLLTEKYGSEVAEKIIIQYGGSVKSNNASALMKQPDIDGALVGGASLKTNEFAKLISNSLVVK